MDNINSAIKHLSEGNPPAIIGLDYDEAIQKLCAHIAKLNSDLASAYERAAAIAETSAKTAADAANKSRILGLHEDAWACDRVEGALDEVAEVIRGLGQTEAANA